MRRVNIPNTKGRVIFLVMIFLVVFLFVLIFVRAPSKPKALRATRKASSEPLKFNNQGEWAAEPLYDHQLKMDPEYLYQKFCNYREGDSRKRPIYPPQPIRFHPNTIRDAIRPDPSDTSRDIITECTYIDPETGYIKIKSDKNYYPNYEGSTLPMCFGIDPRHKIRVNLVYHGIESVGRGLSAGPQGILNMAVAAAKAGFNARIIDFKNYSPKNKIPNNFKLDEQMNFDSFINYFDKVEIWFGGDRKAPIPVSPYDVFIAGFWPTAYPAHYGARDLGRTHFIYLASDYEPLFYPGGSKYAYTYESYTLPHHLVTNAPTMLKNLKARKESLFSGNFESDPDLMSIALKHPIPSIPIFPDKIRERINNSNKRRVLIYARTMDRNAFDLIVHAMRIVYQSGGFSEKDWEFHGVGHHSKPKMDVGFPMQHIGSFGHDEYAKRLSDYDLGISLIITPNINFAQLDFAAAGMISVVNSFETKKQEDYDKIGGNFIAAEPTSHHLAKAIREAIKRVEKVEERIINAKLDWPHSFDEAWEENNIKKYKRMIEDIMYCRWIDKNNDLEHF